MIEQLESVLLSLIRSERLQGSLAGPGAAGQFDQGRADPAGLARALNAAFLIALAGSRHAAFGEASGFLARLAGDSQWGEVARFYLHGLALIREELETISQQDPEFARRLNSLAAWAAHPAHPQNAGEWRERLWAVFCPEAAGIWDQRPERVRALRTERTVRIAEPARAPVADPVRQILFTSNVLLTVPAASTSPAALPFSADLKGALARSAAEPQRYWYDHPIQIGVQPEKNEVLYGLRGLEEALAFERRRGNVASGERLACALSVSVTHQGLHEVAKRYLEEEFARAGGLSHLDVYVFTEADTQRIVDRILAPAARHYLRRDDARDLLDAFGVDGEYGRHYSFLKAIAAFWAVFIRPETKATFKIDLDQVFPQEALVAESGASAFEHFRTALWGARGFDSQAAPVELGMIAGALVNERDIGQSLFVPDVRFPDRALAPDELVFFSTLPQALSTEAEMMARYNTEGLDGRRTCLQRIHVTGGTNGILVESLRRHRPFTPSFIGRAEDQAYLLSVLSQPGPRLAYLHQDGLIMRHDKEAFAQEAIESAYVGKLIGDYVRMLYFSAYARVLTGDVARLKAVVDPFTGCFISRIPRTVTHLRFGLRAASFFEAGQQTRGLEFVTTGARRLANALAFMQGENSQLRRRYEKERRGWDLYYDVLAAVEAALAEGDAFALDLRRQARDLIERCAIHPG